MDDAVDEGRLERAFDELEAALRAWREATLRGDAAHYGEARRAYQAAEAELRAVLPAPPLAD